MCGIAGIYNIDGGPVDTRLLKRMCDILAHRGPDDEGRIFISTKNNAYSSSNSVNGSLDLAFGHRRLAIIDLSSAGHQPMCNEDGTIWITYNGEIYNYREMRNPLETKGHVFKSQSDTEVILHAYEEYGTECFSLFNGMFAFALWDGVKKRLLLVRDRLGIKPLYYYHNSRKLIFSSEVKAILLDSQIDRTLNGHALCDFITFQNILDEKTFFKDIVKLPAGHFLVIKNGRSEKVQYWDLEFKKEHLASVAEYLKKYKEIFVDSVRRHLTSDVPVGSYLSGGFDSASVATIASELLPERISTFTGAFDGGRKYDERQCARDVVKAIHADHREIVISPEDFLRNIERVIYHLDEPSVGSGALPQFMVSQLVSKHVKVVLTGHGGDEFFAGYQVYKSAHYGDLLRKSPLNVFKILPGFKWNELARILYFMIYPFVVPELKYGLYIMFSEKERKELFSPDFAAEIAGYAPISTLENLIAGKTFEPTDRILYLYAKTYLTTLFLQEDKVGMAHSIEARLPLCDNELTRFSMSIPMEYKLYGHTLKYLTKESMKDKLPPSLYHQPKMGFPTPISKWFRKELKDYLYDVLGGERIRKRNILNCDYVKKLLDRHCLGHGETLYDYNNASRLYSLLTIELWHRVFIDNSYSSIGNVTS